MYSVLFKQEQAHEDSIWSCAWVKNEKTGTDHIVTGAVDDIVKCWKWTGEKVELRLNLEGHALGVVAVDINSEGTVCASSSLDCHIRIWDLETGQQLKSFDGGPVDAWTVKFSPDSSFIASGSHSGKINLYGVQSGKMESSMDTRGKFTLSIAMLIPDGKYIASGAIDGIINIFDIATAKLVHTLEGHALPIRSLAFSPDSQFLVTASDDGHRRYTMSRKLSGNAISGHGSWVLHVAYATDGNHFVSCSSDKTVKTWDAHAKQCIHSFNEHSDQVWCAKYNSASNKVVSVSDDRSLIIYDCPN